MERIEGTYTFTHYDTGDVVVVSVSGEFDGELPFYEAEEALVEKAMLTFESDGFELTDYSTEVVA